MATIRDVARRAGVSAGTVSNVLNRPGYVGTEIRSRVLTAIAELDFTPDEQARRFRSGRQRILGLALADLANPFFVDVALGAESEARALDVGVVVIHNAEDDTREQHNLDVLVQQRVHGIMITPVHEDDSRLDKLDARGIPLVYVDRVSAASERCWVKTDDVAGGRIAAEHLTALGHRRLAFVGTVGSRSQIENRFAGFRSVVETAGGETERMDADSWTLADGRAIGAALAQRHPDRRPTAVMCSNDLLALGILLEFSQRGVDVPSDISVVGFDDLSWAESVAVPLTTVRQPREELGRLAVRLLIDEIDHRDRHTHRHELLQPELIVRGTTAPA